MSKLIIIVVLFSIKILNGQSNMDSLRFEHLIIKDTNFLFENFDDSLIYIHSNGLIETKKSFITSVTSGKIMYEKFKFENFQRVVDKFETKVNVGTVNVSGKIDSVSFDVKLKYTSIYKRRKNRFKLVYWQSTKIK